MDSFALPIHGRGSAENPPNRFEPIALEANGDLLDAEELPAPTTQFYRDASRSIIASNDSPDVGFERSVNPYRGCEHGCIYCFARPFHEYLGLSAGLDFETKIFVKMDAAELLRAELGSPKWQPQLIAMSGVTDCYQPVEARLKLTRACIEVLAEFRNPVTFITKNHLITRDLDLLTQLAAINAVSVNVSVTTLDPEISAVMEPRTSTPARRLAAIEKLSQAGVPVGAFLAPLIPGLTDHELPQLLDAVAGAGAKWAMFLNVRLPGAVEPLFDAWLQRHFPNRREKVLNRIRELRGGKLNEPAFGQRMRGQGKFYEQMRSLFHIGLRKHGLNKGPPELNVTEFRRPSGPQLTLWE